MRISAVIATAALAALAVLSLSAPAFAHDELLSTNPQGGSTVQTIPDAVSLTFSDVVPPATGDANEIRVTDASGTILNDGPLSIQDNVVSQPVSGGVAGAVQVLWRVVSRDGHPVSGSFSFTLAVSATATAVPEATATPTTLPAEDPLMQAASPVPWIVGGIIVAVVVAGVVVLLVVRSRRTDDQ